MILKSIKTIFISFRECKLLKIDENIKTNVMLRKVEFLNGNHWSCYLLSKQFGKCLSVLEIVLDIEQLIHPILITNDLYTNKDLKNHLFIRIV